MYARPFQLGTLLLTLLVVIEAAASSSSFCCCSCSAAAAPAYHRRRHNCRDGRESSATAMLQCLCILVAIHIVLNCNLLLQSATMLRMGDSLPVIIPLDRRTIARSLSIIPLGYALINEKEFLRILQLLSPQTFRNPKP